MKNTHTQTYLFSKDRIYENKDRSRLTKIYIYKCIKMS